MRSCLICDDHALVREALTGTILTAWPDVEITHAGNYGDAWTAASDGHDFCLADLSMPGADPIAGIEGIRSAAPDMPLLIVTGSADDRLMLQLLDMGISGFITKNVSGAVIEAAIRLILAGGRYIPERLASLVPTRQAEPLAYTVAFTDRQADVVRLVSAGLSNKEIARQLGIAPSSVKTHLSAAMELLGTANRAETSARASQLGLI